MESSKSKGATGNFTSQNLTAEDLLKSQTSGLVSLSDFRKRRAEAFELREKEAQDASRGITPSSGVTTPIERAQTPQPPKKKKKTIAKGKLSFGLDDDHENDSPHHEDTTKLDNKHTDTSSAGAEKHKSSSTDTESKQHRLGPNQGVSGPHRILSRSAQAKEVELKEKLRKDFLLMQEAVKATEILVPFVFYDGSNTPGGICRMKKGDHIWLMLDRSRKVGAELGLGGSDKSKKEWARVSVDDLMLVQNEIIIPHHYDFYYFLVNKSHGFKGPIFDYSDKPTAATPMMATNPERNPLSRPGQQDGNAADESLLEGSGHDPSLSKVVDRRWYEKNKHIYPASTWEEFEPEKDYSKAFRKDTQGNSFFFT